MAKDWQYRHKREKEKEVFQEFDDWSRQDLMEYILQLRSGLDEMQEIIKHGTSNPASDPEKAFTETDYKQGWSYPTKIAFLLTINKKPLTSEELHKLLLKLDSHYKDYDSPRNNLTVTLNRTLKSGRIKKIKVPGIRSLYYALPEWVDKEGEIKPPFKHHFQFFV
ncbi:MAG: hypothetical protein HY062_01785 [Bacteroidetes bacterium]|nr:hypothetical protein [Bacteroidota bacterium]